MPLGHKPHPLALLEAACLDAYVAAGCSVVNCTLLTLGGARGWLVAGLHYTGATLLDRCRYRALELRATISFRAFSVLASFNQNIGVSHSCYSMHPRASDRGYRQALQGQKGAILDASNVTENSAFGGG